MSSTSGTPASAPCRQGEHQARWPSVAAAGLLAVWLAVCAGCPQAVAASRVKDIADFEGVRTNMLVGYGLVVGLNGTGDTPAQLDVHPGKPGRDAGAVGRRARAATTSTPRTSPRSWSPRPCRRSPARAAGSTSSVSALGDSKSLLGGYAAGHAAAGRRRRSLRGGPGCAQRRRLPGAGRCRDGHPRRADRGPDPRRGDHRARGRVRARRA